MVVVANSADLGGRSKYSNENFEDPTPARPRGHVDIVLRGDIDNTGSLGPAGVAILEHASVEDVNAIVPEQVLRGKRVVAVDKSAVP